MNPVFSFLASAILLSGALSAASPAASVFPNEKLDYTINWPSGLSFGEAHWTARNTGTAEAPVWTSSLAFDAHIPGFALSNAYQSTSSASYCTERLARSIQHGVKSTTETETVDPQTLIVTRRPASGNGESKFAVPDCVKDALSFLFFTRHELLSGRIPPAQNILFGALYQVKLTSLGTHSVQSGGKAGLADRIGCAIQGPASTVNAEIDFAQDPVRTPLAVRIPVSLGTVALELVR